MDQDVALYLLHVLYISFSFHRFLANGAYLRVSFSFLNGVDLSVVYKRMCVRLNM